MPPIHPYFQQAPLFQPMSSVQKAGIGILLVGIALTALGLTFLLRNSCFSLHPVDKSLFQVIEYESLEAGLFLSIIGGVFHRFFKKFECKDSFAKITEESLGSEQRTSLQWTQFMKNGSQGMKCYQVQGATSLEGVDLISEGLSKNPKLSEPQKKPKVEWKMSILTIDFHCIGPEITLILSRDHSLAMVWQVHDKKYLHIEENMQGLDQILDHNPFVSLRTGHLTISGLPKG